MPRPEPPARQAGRSADGVRHSHRPSHVLRGPEPAAAETVAGVRAAYPARRRRRSSSARCAHAACHLSRRAEGSTWWIDDGGTRPALARAFGETGGGGAQAGGDREMEAGRSGPRSELARSRHAPERVAMRKNLEKSWARVDRSAAAVGHRRLISSWRGDGEARLAFCDVWANFLGRERDRARERSSSRRRSGRESGGREEGWRTCASRGCQMTACWSGSSCWSRSRTG